MFLSFSLFVDWFNPLTNKLAGKQVSLGVVALNCLNLPPNTRWKLQNTFISGIIPAPNEPNPITINNILMPLVDDLIKLHPGIIIRTPNSPNGRKIVVKLGCLIGDLVATNKVAGFASHSATSFCTWCECTKAQLPDLEIARLHKCHIVRHYSNAFKDAQNQTQADRLVKKSGVRWSELNRLPYWDPVRHTSLGILHMWFEGILQNHFLNQWKWIILKQKESDASKKEINQPSIIEDEMEIDNPDSKIPGLSTEQVTRLKALFKEVIIPSGITRVPKEVGTLKEGKLKATEWQLLFSIYLPLTVLDVFLGDFEFFESNSLSNRLLLKNLCALVTCTNILISHSITEDQCNLFAQRYKTYCQTSQELFLNCKITPNSHYALDVKSQLAWWGPLNAISEHPGERLNGFLQSFKNDGKVEKFGETIMTSFCQWQRLVATNVLPRFAKKKDPLEVDFELDREMYSKILSFLRLTEPTIRDHTHIPHPDGSKVFLKYAKEILILLCGNQPNVFKIGKRPPNNIIRYKSGEGTSSFGFVLHIIRVPLENHSNTLVLVRKMIERKYPPTQPLSMIFEHLSILHLRGTHELEIVQPFDISGVCAYRELPAWSLGLKEPSTIVRLIREGEMIMETDM
ncbi:hypothetical protein O181_021357 [Austropuccinia psidii MF-1]|uniref:Uncharacterized protein n=1 Tax=Austropuccinia psidii MF-1 TaxID=1389203 RepID=A0A9Q3CDH9_9BASI|nr:hypothetical protein [Austropuccinia psidii MF-1]